MISIIKTLAYFDIFDTPLTKEEILRWLWQENSNLPKITSNLDSLIKENKIGYKHGYYFLPNREKIVETRQRTTPIIEEKIQIAKRACKKLRWLPFLKAVFVCNTTAGGGVKKTSDIDVFIVIKKGRIWITRLLSVLLLNFFRLRRNKKNIANKICLSFYATDEALDLSAISIEQPDVYLIYWIDNLIPIYDPQGFHTEILGENLWVKKYIPNALQSYMRTDIICARSGIIEQAHNSTHSLDYKTWHRWKADDSQLSKLFKKLFESIWKDGYGNLVERQAKEAQKIKMKFNYDSSQNKENTGVIINDSMLKFHENDQRKYFKELWEEKITSYGLRVTDY